MKFLLSKAWNIKEEWATDRERWIGLCKDPLPRTGRQWRNVRKVRKYSNQTHHAIGTYGVECWVMRTKQEHILNKTEITMDASMDDLD